MMWGRNLIGVAAVVMASGCSAVQDTAVAEQAVDQFHDAYNQDQFDRVYADATEEITRGTSREAFTTTMGDMKGRLGAYRNGSRTGINVNYNGNGSFVALGFDSEFERGRANEQFTFRMVDGRARLAGYQFNVTSLGGGVSNSSEPAPPPGAPGNPSDDAGNAAADH